eukprot:m.169526 g.169526  ORF g.169526 m.169526 type:complete len:518 (-) comp13113_c0_seq1:294-1847(-)
MVLWGLSQMWDHSHVRIAFVQKGSLARRPCEQPLSYLITTAPDCAHTICLESMQLRSQIQGQAFTATPSSITAASTSTTSPRRTSVIRTKEVDTPESLTSTEPLDTTGDRFKDAWIGGRPRNESTFTDMNTTDNTNGDDGAASPSLLMTPSLPLPELDFSMLPDGDFGGGIDALLPPSPNDGESGMDLDGGASESVVIPPPITSSASSSGAAAVTDTNPMDMGGVGLDDLDDIELLGEDSPPVYFDNSMGGSTAGGPPGPKALTDKAVLSGEGSNRFSIESVFPSAGSRFSPLRQYQMLDSKQPRRAPSTLSSSGLGGQFGWGNGSSGAGVGEADDASDGAIMPYSRRPNLGGVKLEVDELDMDLPALEFSGWDAQQREKVRKNPPKSMKTITDLELAYVDLKDLNTLMDKAGYTEEQKRQTKIRRRKVKNRNSAKGSATKKRTQYHSIAQTNKQLLDVVTELQNRNTQLASANNELLQQTEQARQIAEQALKEKERFQREIDRLTRLLGNMQAKEK